MHWEYKLNKTREAPQDQLQLMWVSQPLVLHSIAALSASFLPLERAKLFPTLDPCSCDSICLDYCLPQALYLEGSYTHAGLFGHASSERASLTIPILL